MTWDMIGHQWAIDLLQRHIRQNAVRHAYLITGPRAIGKRTLALRFAQALFCEQPPEPGGYCGTCRACRQTLSGTFPDLHIVEAAAEGEVLKVDQVRSLGRSLALAPYEGRYRIALLLRAHEASISALNALLKTLEEPPDHVVLLLTAHAAEGLLPTLVSRCETLALRPQPRAVIAEALKQRFGDQASLQAAVRLAGGLPGKALTLAGDPDALKSQQVAIEEMLQLLQLTRRERFRFAERSAGAREGESGRQRVLGLLGIWLSFWRDVIMRLFSADVELFQTEAEEEIAAICSAVEPERAVQFAVAIQETIEALRQNANPRLALEVLLLKLPGLKGGG